MFKEYFIQAVRYWKEKSLYHAFIRLPVRGKSFQDKTFAQNRGTKKFFLRKSERTVEWEGQVNAFLLTERIATNELKKLGLMFSEKEHCLVAIWTFSYSNNITKEGLINSKVPDLENSKKPIQDILINEVVGVDDKSVLCAIERRTTGNDSISLHLFLIDRKSIDDMNIVI